MIGGALSTRGLWLDPRTKILLLLLCIFSAMMAPSLLYELGLVVLIGLLGVCFGKWKYAWKGVLFYALIVLLTIWIMDTMTGTWRTMFIAFLGLFHKVYPCGMLSGIVISTTKVSEFLSAMNRIHAPQKLVIPLAVMLRYIPTIQEDWRFIKDAMRMRDVSPSLKGFLTHPGITVECIYVPLMMAASKAADELSIASITRGIENPKPRTCLVQIHIGLMDIAAVFCFAGALAVGLPLHLNALNRPTGMPRQVIAVSPGSIPSSQKERAEMQALNSRDVMVDAAFMETDRKIMTKGQPVPVYMLSGPKGDFTGLPPVHFYYGGDEVLSVVAESFADACKAANVPYTMTIAPGMCHCYAMVEWFPEGRQAREEIIGLLR